MPQNHHHRPPEQDAPVAEAAGGVARDPGQEDVRDGVNGVEQVEDVGVLVVSEAEVDLEGLVQGCGVVVGIVVAEENEAARGEDRPADAAGSDRRWVGEWGLDDGCFVFYGGVDVVVEGWWVGGNDCGAGGAGEVRWRG